MSWRSAPGGTGLFLGRGLSSMRMCRHRSWLAPPAPEIRVRNSSDSAMGCREGQERAGRRNAREGRRQSRRDPPQSADTPCPGDESHSHVSESSRRSSGVQVKVRFLGARSDMLCPATIARFADSIKCHASEAGVWRASGVVSCVQSSAPVSCFRPEAAMSPLQTVEACLCPPHQGDDRRHPHGLDVAGTSIHK